MSNARVTASAPGAVWRIIEAACAKRSSDAIPFGTACDPPKPVIVRRYFSESSYGLFVAPARRLLPFRIVTIDAL